MTTFMHFSFEKTIALPSEFRILVCVIILLFSSYSVIYSQTNSEKPSSHSYMENGWVNDLVPDPEYRAGIEMIMIGTANQGSTKIALEIEYLQEGNTVVQVLDAHSGEILMSLREGPSKIGKETFEIDQSDIHVRSILIVATLTLSTGQSILSSLQIETSRTEDIPLSLNETGDIDFKAQLTPTLGRGLFQISAEFKGSGRASVKVYDLNGSLVETLFSGNIHAGSVTFEGNSSNWITGKYIVCIHTDKGSWVRKMMVQ